MARMGEIIPENPCSPCHPWLVFLRFFGFPFPLPLADAALDAIMKRDAFGLGLAPVVVAPTAGGQLAAALARDGERLWPGKA